MSCDCLLGQGFIGSGPGVRIPSRFLALSGIGQSLRRVPPFLRYLLFPGCVETVLLATCWSPCGQRRPAHCGAVPLPRAAAESWQSRYAACSRGVSLFTPLGSQLGGPLDGARHQGDAVAADDQAAVGVVRGFCAVGLSLTGVAFLGCWRQRRLLGLAVCDRPYRRAFGRRRASGSLLRALVRPVISPRMQGLGLALACHCRHPGVRFLRSMPLLLFLDRGSAGWTWSSLNCLKLDHYLVPVDGARLLPVCSLPRPADAGGCTSSPLYRLFPALPGHPAWRRIGLWVPVVGMVDAV